MTNTPRVDGPGLWHHVMNRGHNRQDIFRDDQDCELFRDLLKEVTGEDGIEIHSYAFMSNHFHLFVHTPTGGLPKAMQFAEGVYAQRFNQKYDLENAVYKGRYRSVVIDSEAHFLECPRYIDNNPVKAGLVEDPGEYRWSSYRTLAFDEPAIDFLSTDVLLPNYFDGDPHAYRTFVNRSESEQAQEYATIISQDWQNIELTEAVQNRRREIEQLGPEGPVALVEKFVSAAMGVPREGLYARSGVSRKTQTAAALALTLLYRLSVATPTELASLYGFGGRSGVTSAIHRFEHRAATDPELAPLLSAGLQLLSKIAA